MALPSAADFIGSGITEAQFKTAIVALRDYVADFEAISPGQLAFFKRTTPPDGYLKANGAAVSVSTYAVLDDAIYCGDANNATADCCYHCTDPGDPDGTRSTTGGYLVLPDERGEFLRGWDDARGVDVSRSLWSHQDDQNKSHSHTGTAASGGAHTHSTSIPGVRDEGGGAAAVPTNQNTIGSASFVSSSAGAHTHTVTINADGGTEARVRNNPWLACIKY